MQETVSLIRCMHAPNMKNTQVLSRRGVETPAQRGLIHTVDLITTGGLTLFSQRVSPNTPYG